ncbi:hypothetical protein OZX61_12860 (plasmid) [Acinetobacter sp. ESL0695]|uniref:hypothetical protein n=1 Tax=Acinetobacter sp. ESL0695 TaxID=2983215 RepID=UPI0023F09233|nr:hypothetical protein [Acinetobacter sp. ESL0695]WEV50232.1 hypothetical protein OZX61_12860 [Acinetobacter sp. ESL0695]
MIDKDALIQEVAKKHHVLLSKDDPIFVSVTLSELVLKHYIDQIDHKLSNTEETFYEMKRDAEDTAQTIANKLITKGAEYINLEMEKAADKVVIKVKNEIENLNIEKSKLVTDIEQLNKKSGMQEKMILFLVGTTLTIAILNLVLLLFRYH